MTNEEYWFWLCNVKNMFQPKAAKLMEVFHSPHNIYNASKRQLLKIPGISEEDVTNIIISKKEFNIEENLKKLNEFNINFVCYGSENYPKRLLPYEHKPLWFFVKGEMPSDDVPSVAIVGARNCTGYGKSMAKEIAYDLTKAGVQVISGMARGIDSYSHTGALNAGGKTFAVLGCGPDICYPKENINMYSDIIKNGGIISEYVPGTMPFAMQFPQRNRIISGLSDRIIVIEAREKSGSLITVEWALEQGKDIMALPGRTTDSLSTGCNRLIKSGAALITSAKDVLEEMGLKTEEKQEEKKINIALEKDLQVVYSCVDLSLKHLHIIIEETGFEYEKTVKILLELQMLNLIDEPVKDYFMRKT